MVLPFKKIDTLIYIESIFDWNERSRGFLLGFLAVFKNPFGKV